jgi:hypothetical protein
MSAGRSICSELNDFIRRRSNNPPSNNARVLYVALDESNHGGYPEVVGAVASTKSKDIHESKFPSKKALDASALAEFLKAPFRTFAYTRVRKEQVPKGSNALIEAMPRLVETLAVARIGISRIEILVDGKQRKENLEWAGEVVYARTGVPQIITIAYVKSSRNSETKLLWAADTLAYCVFKDSKKIGEALRPLRRGRRFMPFASSRPIW